MKKVKIEIAYFIWESSEFNYWFFEAKMVYDCDEENREAVSYAFGSKKISPEDLKISETTSDSLKKFRIFIRTVLPVSYPDEFYKRILLTNDGIHTQTHKTMSNSIYRSLLVEVGLLSRRVGWNDCLEVWEKRKRFQLSECLRNCFGVSSDVSKTWNRLTFASSFARRVSKKFGEWTSNNGIFSKSIF